MQLVLAFGSMQETLQWTEALHQATLAQTSRAETTGCPPPVTPAPEQGCDNGLSQAKQLRDSLADRLASVQQEASRDAARRAELEAESRRIRRKAEDLLWDVSGMP